MISGVQPLFTASLMMVMIALIRLWRQTSGRKPVFLAGSVFALFLLSWPPFAWLVLQFLERPFPVRNLRAEDASAIVVLASGAAYPTVPALPPARVASDTYERCQYGAWLYRNWQPLPILVSGGTDSSAPNAPPYAMEMRAALQKEGVPDSMIWAEDQSHSTHENALYSAAILHNKGIRKVVLVTDAYHMLRAEKSFRKQGLEVVPAACGYRSFHHIYADTVLPGWEPIGFNEDSFHEILGLLWYWIRGWI